MRVFAVICEFDPLHRGHEYLLRSAREAGAECIVCVMSGAFCQRGEPAAFDTHTRAAAAIAAGADLVLELPFPYSCASAEYFARGAVGVIEALGGVDTLAFGCECGDAEALEGCAEALMSDEFYREYENVCKTEKALGTAAQIELALYRVSPDSASLLRGANNTLAIEYMKAARRRGLSLSYHAAARKGSGHGELDEGESFASASLIRKCLHEKKDISKYLPDACSDIIIGAAGEMPEPPSLKLAERAVISHLRSCADAEPCAGAEGGLFRRLADAACHARSYEELIALSKTKKYTDARIRRSVIFSMCGVMAEHLKADPSYIRMLGANARGIEFLSSVKKSISLPFISNPSKAGALVETARGQFELCRRAYALRSLCRYDISDAERELKIPPVIVK